MSGIKNSAKDAIDVVDTAVKILEKLGPYKPDVKNLTVDYLTKTSLLKLLINVPQGVKRRVRDIEIPAYSGYQVYEVYEGDSLNKLDLDWVYENGKWKVDAANLPNCEKYFVTLRGSVSPSALNQIIGVYCPEDPKKEKELDKYWIQSGIKDMSILEKIYSELSVERVAVDVKVGVQRPFATSIPDNVREWLEARAKADEAMETADRQLMFHEWMKYRQSRKQLGKFSADSIVQAARNILSPETFLLFVSIDDPFKLGGISSIIQSGLIPDAIKVTVQTDLNFRRPAAQGNLTFFKEKFSDKLSSEFEDLSGGKSSKNSQ